MQDRDIPCMSNLEKARAHEVRFEKQSQQFQRAPQKQTDMEDDETRLSSIIQNLPSREDNNNANYNGNNGEKGMSNNFMAGTKTDKEGVLNERATTKTMFSDRPINENMFKTTEIQKLMQGDPMNNVKVSFVAGESNAGKFFTFTLFWANSVSPGDLKFVQKNNKDSQLNLCPLIKVIN